MKGLKATLLVGLLVLSSTVCVSAQTTPTPQNASNEDFELNTLLMQSTFMLQGKSAQGQDAIGSGFVMGRPYANQQRARYVLITAAHVLEDMQGETITIHLRKRLADNTWTELPYPVPIRANGRALWTKHPNADVAVMYIRLPTEISIPLISTALLADDGMLSKFEIHPGDELQCLGYPLGFASNSAGFPILRSGKVASYPLLPTETTQTFLFDFRIFKGNSGGPVYFAQSNRVYQNATHLGESIHFIVGLISEEKVLPQLTVGVYEQEMRQVQLGLAVVVHASLIKQAINMLPAPETLPD